MKRVWIWLLMCYAMQGKSAGEYRSFSALHTGLGQASSAWHDGFAFRYNPAALARLERPEFALGTMSCFVPQGWWGSAAAVSWPVRRLGTFAGGLSFFGDRYYRELNLGFAYSRHLAKKVYIGLRVDYLNLSIAGLGNTSSFAFDIGLQYAPLSKLSLGFNVFNPTRLKVGRDPYIQRYSTLLQWGLRYNPIPSLSLVAELEKDLLFPLNVKAGLHYAALPYFHATIGFQSSPWQLGFAAGTCWRGLCIDLAANWYFPRGVSPALSLRYILPARNE